MLRSNGPLGAAREIEEMAAVQEAVRVIEENLQQREFPVVSGVSTPASENNRRALKSSCQPANLRHGLGGSSGAARCERLSTL
jgi:hypothetical protein